MTQATYSIRLDRDKKAKFDEICNRLGLSASAAFSTFVNKTIEKRGNEAKKDIQSIFSFIKSISSEQNAKKPRHHHFQTFRLRERLKIETLWLPGLVASFC